MWTCCVWALCPAAPPARRPLRRPPFLSDQERGERSRHSSAVVAVAPAGSTIKRDDCTGGDPELVGKMRALLVAASTAAAIVGVVGRVVDPSTPPFSHFRSRYVAPF